jgi:SAM-dependent methyltransferase
MLLPKLGAKSNRHTYIFDEDYYKRFYGLRRPRRADQREAALLGDFVCAYLRYLGQPVRSVLDIGCGLGLWEDVISRNFPKALYSGVEISAYLCEKYGWGFGSVVDYQARRSFDFVVCKDVLQYLSSVEAAAAINNFARLCRGALYFNVLTNEDWEENCDQAQSNGDVYKRPAGWYRGRLGQHFLNLGGGLFLRRSSPIVVWELERLR